MCGSENYTLCIRSVNRVAGNASDYSVTVPKIPKGLYKTTFSMAADNTVVQEVRVRWNVTNYFDTSSYGYATALTVSYDAKGVLYITDPGSTIDIQIYDTHSGALYDQEHQILVHLEKQ
jgi:hypothetical protein